MGIVEWLRFLYGKVKDCLGGLGLGLWNKVGG